MEKLVKDLALWLSNQPLDNVSGKFQQSIWCAGKELFLVDIYNEEETPNWDCGEIKGRDYGKNPVFIHIGKYHGLYKPISDYPLQQKGYFMNLPAGYISLENINLKINFYDEMEDVKKKRIWKYTTETGDAVWYYHIQLKDDKTYNYPIPTEFKSTNV